jgi:hypothetical protein
MANYEILHKISEGCSTIKNGCPGAGAGGFHHFGTDAEVVRTSRRRTDAQVEPERWRVQPSGILSLSSQRVRCRTSQLQDYRVYEYRLPSPPSVTCNELRESLTEDSRNISCATLKRRVTWVISISLGRTGVHRTKIGKIWLHSVCGPFYNKYCAIGSTCAEVVAELPYRPWLQHDSVVKLFVAISIILLFK